MSPRQVERTLIRLAYEIVERNRGADNVTIFGIKNAGAELARSLSVHLGKILERNIQSYDLDVTAFRDDVDGADTTIINGRDGRGVGGVSSLSSLLGDDSIAMFSCKIYSIF